MEAPDFLARVKRSETISVRVRKDATHPTRNLK